ncbi:hypothetical protein ADK90_19575 [Streptomyces sp. XY413]|nr:hypothetical protein ADK90_19575 [Streptomyces sp. XY413]
MVTPSAITLMLLTYVPTGAPIAAVTMGLLEQIGGSATATTARPFPSDHLADQMKMAARWSPAR